MSDLERARWRIIARAWLAALGVWFAAFVILDTLGDRPALMWTAYALAVVAVGAAFVGLARRKRTAATREELRQVSKTQWKREG